MAILIPDMEMPKNCMDCDLQYDMCACILTGTRFWSKDTFDPATEKLSDCPIKEVGIEDRTKLLKEVAGLPFFSEFVYCQECVHGGEGSYGVIPCDKHGYGRVNGTCFDGEK